MRTVPGMLIVFACVCAALVGCGTGGRQTGSGAVVMDPCHVGGCSKEVCSDRPDVVSPCIFKPEFNCYQTATCEPQQDGACGWTQTPELTACIANATP